MSEDGGIKKLFHDLHDTREVNGKRYTIVLVPASAIFICGYGHAIAVACHDGWKPSDAAAACPEKCMVCDRPMRRDVDTEMDNGWFGLNWEKPLSLPTWVLDERI